MITIVYGKPGCGKTAFLAADGAHWMDYSHDSLALFRECHERVEALREEGYDFTLPDRPPVYSNFSLSVPCGVIEPFKSYCLDGYETGFEPEDESYPNSPVYPCSRIYFSEAQRYYNARLFSKMPDWISRYYEQHRHFGLEIFLDVQRAGLIDLNIREIAERFILMRRIVHKVDAIGNILSSTFHYYEFSDCKEVDRFCESGAGEYVERTSVYDGCIFDCYDSTSYYRSFIPKRGVDFSHRDHPDPSSDTYVEEFERAYPQQAPEGFYGKKQENNRRHRKAREVMESEYS